MTSNPFTDMLKDAVREVLQEFIKYPDVRAKRLLDPVEAGQYLGVSRSRIYELISFGELPVVRSGRSTLLDKDDLDGWIKEHKVQGRKGTFVKPACDDL